jgi:DNA-binding response OmpR family regulator
MAGCSGRVARGIVTLAVRLLIVEDDKKAAALLAKGLREERFAVDLAYSGEAGDEMASVNEYDAIILDWLLPDRDGVAVCRDLRARGVATPILMLTARDALEDRVTGLNTGADDYLTKPFGFAELLARVHALLRRSDITRPVVLQIADLTLDPLRYAVARGGVPISLTPKEYGVLEVLMRHAGQVVTRSRLAEAVWETELDALTNLVDVHVSHLRRKVDVEGKPALIHTVRGRGYSMGLVEP